MRREILPTKKEEGITVVGADRPGFTAGIEQVPRLVIPESRYRLLFSLGMTQVDIL